MNLDILHPEKSNELFGLKDNFVFFKNLIENENLPKVNLITGEKGIGKSTLINHLIHFFMYQFSVIMVAFIFLQT